MKEFIYDIENWFYKKKILIDSHIFDAENILRACYETIDKLYVYIKKEKDFFEICLQTKENIDIDNICFELYQNIIFQKIKNIIDWKYDDLRWKIIDTIIWFWSSIKGIKNKVKYIDNQIKEIQNSYKDINVTQQTDIWSESKEKSIDEIISEIENDANFKDDKDEIIKLLKEIDSNEPDSKK